MHEFNKYIHSIIDGLKISQKKKNELSEEFMDHLESLKLEYVHDGLPEKEAVQKAIGTFGDSVDFKKKMRDALSLYRSTYSIFVGLLIIVIVAIISYFPMSGVMGTFSSSGTAYKTIPMKINFNETLPFSFIFFIPFGYFIPVVMNRTLKWIQLGLIHSMLGILVGLLTCIVLGSTPDVLSLLRSAVEGLVGGLLGHLALLLTCRMNVMLQDRKMKGADFQSTHK
jgi:hypothetical protein